MCKVGDIIIVKEYVDNGLTLSRHSFVVLSDELGNIQGLDYDIVCNVMSSFKNEEHKKKKLSYLTNFPVTYEDLDITNGGNKKNGYIKANQFYYFNKEKTDFLVIGSLNNDVFESLLKLIEQLKTVYEVIDNL